MEEKIIYTTKEAAKYLGISNSTIYRMEKQGLISSIKTPGGQRRFNKKNIENYLKESRNFTAPQNPSKYKKTALMIREMESTYSVKNIESKLPSNELFLKTELENIKNTIIQGDCLDILKQIKSNTIDLIITSPPYYKQREYSGIGIGNEQSETEYLNNIIAVFNESVRVTKNTGVIVFNIGDKYEESGLRLIPQRFAIRVIDSKKAFLVNNLTWEKLNPTPRQDRKKLVQSTEPFFIFAKTKNYVFNLDNFMSHLKALNGSKQKNNGSNGIGKSYFNLIDSSNLAPQEKEHAKRELQKTILDVKSGLIESFRMKIRGIHAEPYGGQAGGRQIQLDKNGFTIIRINGEKLKRDIIESPVESIKNNQHPAIYPLFIVQELVKLLSNPNDIVLDPFAGSGTTCLAAKNQKRNYVGIEISPEYVNYANERLTTENQFINELFI